jgi:nucleotide-binding universal stress UspA family protein
MRTKETLVPESRRMRRMDWEPGKPNSLTIRGVLVALDFSPASFKGLEYALPLVKHFDAQLHLVHAFDFDYRPSMLAAMPIALPEVELGRHARRRLRHIANKYAIALPPESLHVVQGRAYQAICGLARKLETDLVVLATRGHTGLKHIFLGSTAERIVQHASCPVLVVREKERDFVQRKPNGNSPRSIQLQKILVPLDFSDCSIAGLEFAIRFASAWSAKLVLLNCMPVSSFEPSGPYGAYGFPEINTYAQDAAEKEMRDLTAALKKRGVDAETVVELGVPAHSICNYARAHEVDLIAMSTHGSTGLTHALIGSTTEHVVRYADCPVLTCRPVGKGLES